MLNLQKLNGGWGWVVNNENNLPTNCQNCKDKLNYHNFFWFQPLNKFYCYNCSTNPKINPLIQGTYWHIIKIMKEEEIEDEIEEYEDTY